MSMSKFASNVYSLNSVADALWYGIIYMFICKVHQLCCCPVRQSIHINQQQFYCCFFLFAIQMDAKTAPVGGLIRITIWKDFIFHQLPKLCGWFLKRPPIDWTDSVTAGGREVWRWRKLSLWHNFNASDNLWSQRFVGNTVAILLFWSVAELTCSSILAVDCQKKWELAWWRIGCQPLVLVVAYYILCVRYPNLIFHGYIAAVVWSLRCLCDTFNVIARISAFGLWVLLYPWRIKKDSK